MRLIIASELRSILHYDPVTGIFRWAMDRSQTFRKGMVAGGVNPFGYRLIKIDGRSYMEHRLAWLWMTGSWPEHQIDHSNMVKSDNRWANLREATKSQNLANTRPRSNKTGLRGVTVDRYGKWISQIQFNKKKICIGLFDTPEEAHAAYVKKQKELFGEFARAA